MPYTVVSLKARMRDHAISVPAPEATRRFGIPNACTECHRDHDAAWAEKALAGWGVARAGRRTVARAEAFTGGARGDEAALPALLAMAADVGEPPLVRANAVGHLRRYPPARVGPALVQALRAEPAVVRAVAALTLAEGENVDAVRVALVAALDDPRRVVRVGAAFALVNRGVTRLPGEEGARLERAKSEYVRRGALLPDHAPTQLTLGQFLFLDRAYDGAADAFQSALRLQSELPGGRYFLGLARLGQGRAAEARGELAAVPRGDPHYEDARRVLASLKSAPQKR
jgi:tetratricopeptide (TPR) repeat protein